MEIKTPISNEVLSKLKIGDTVYLTGVIYTGRDAAHKKLVELINDGKKIPFKIESNVIFYVGPTPAKPNEVVGSAGPTSSYRMDPFLQKVLPYFNVSIGKGPRSENVKKLLINSGIYLSATGGAAALISESIKKSEVVAFPELGPEAIHRFEVIRFPAIVTYDMHGGDLLTEGINKYKKITCK